MKEEISRVTSKVLVRVNLWVVVPLSRVRDREDIDLHPILQNFMGRILGLPSVRTSSRIFHNGHIFFLQITQIFTISRNAFSGAQYLIEMEWVIKFTFKST